MSSVLPPMPGVRPLPPAWRAALPAILVAVLGLLLLYRESALAMVGIWERSATFAHAFVVPPISAWLIWRQRAALALLQPRPCYWFLLPLALAALLASLGDLAAVNALTHLALVAMLVLLVPLLLGPGVARVLTFPLGFLFFAVPIGEFMMPQLMETTADFTVAALRLSGIPVYREGQHFIIPSGNWSVVEACSGLRYLMASVMVGTLFAHLNYRSMRRRLGFVAFSILLPLVANWVRAYLIVMLGHLSNNELATGADHLIYGWVFFGFVMLIMFMIGARWAEHVAPPAPTPVAAWPERAGGVGPVWAAAALALALLAAPQQLLRAYDHRDGGLRPPLGALTLPGWQATAEPLSDWKPLFENPAAELQATYAGSDPARRVGLHLAYYRHQDFHSKLITSQNQLVLEDDRRWARVGSATHGMELGGEPLRLREVELRALNGPGQPEQRLLVWQFYWVNGRLTSSDLRAKAYGVLDRLLGRGDDAAAVILATPKDADNGVQARQRLTGFLRDNWASVQAQLERARAAP